MFNTTDYVGSFAKLRHLPCPQRVMDGVRDRKEFPRNAYIIFDHTELPRVFQNTLIALTHPCCNNRIVIPELCLDWFDHEHKEAHSENHRAVGESEKDDAHSRVALSKDLQKVLLDAKKHGIILQTVRQYDTAVVGALDMPRGGPASFNNNGLYAACAAYFHRTLAETDRDGDSLDKVIFVSRDPSMKKTMKAMKATEHVDVCTYEEMLNYSAVR